MKELAVYIQKRYSCPGFVKDCAEELFTLLQERPGGLLIGNVAFASLDADLHALFVIQRRPRCQRPFDLALSGNPAELGATVAFALIESVPKFHHPRFIFRMDPFDEMLRPDLL